MPPLVGRRTALGALAVAGVGGVALWRGASARAGTSIAVMPFADLSGDPRQTCFADGVAEELRDALGRLPNLKVIARSSFEALREANAVAAARQLGVGHITELASVRSYQLRLGDALVLYRRAETIGEDATYLRYASVFYACVGRANEADALIEKLFAVDPISGLSYKNQAWACCLNGEFYAFFFAGAAMIASGRYRDGITEVSATPADNILRPVLETIAWRELGNRSRVARSLERLHDLAGDGASIQRAWIHAQFGEIDLAFARLDRALERRSWVLIEVPANPFLAPLWADPRFPAFLGRLGVP